MGERVQIKFDYNAGEDRLLLCISERKKHNSCIEYRFWLTRRFVNVFLRAIDKLITDELTADMLVAPEAIAAVKKFQHEAALSKADFSTSYGADAEKCTLFREKSLLVTKLKIKKKSNGKYVLALLNNENMGINLMANMDLIHSLQKMLLDSVGNAAWNQPVFQAADEKSEKHAPDGYVS